jgi:outer membrane protein OmpA-like peptidoglycan-associated protein
MKPYTMMSGNGFRAIPIRLYHIKQSLPLTLFFIAGVVFAHCFGTQIAALTGSHFFHMPQAVKASMLISSTGSPAHNAGDRPKPPATEQAAVIAADTQKLTKQPVAGITADTAISVANHDAGIPSFSAKSKLVIKSVSAAAAGQGAVKKQILTPAEINRISLNAVKCERIMRQLPETHHMVILNFDFNAFKPNPATEADKFAEKLLLANTDPVDKIIVTGFTDNSGNERWNILLGLKRAEHVKKQLIRLGFAKEKIEVVSFGMNLAIGDNRPKKAVKRTGGWKSTSKLMDILTVEPLWDTRYFSISMKPVSMKYRFLMCTS